VCAPQRAPRSATQLASRCQSRSTAKTAFPSSESGIFDLARQRGEMRYTFEALDGPAHSDARYIVGVV